MISHLLALGAGLATAGSPCILPMLPLLLAASVAPAASGVAHAGGDARSPAPSRWRPLAIVLGFVAAFSAAAWLLGASARVLGVPPQHWRTGAIVVMLGMGLMLLWPSLLARLMQPLGGLADVAHRLGQRAGAGLLGGVLLGMSLGLLWTPCAGPVLASVLALIATEPQAPQALGLLVAYALGAGLPMLALAYGGQAVLARTRGLMRHAERVRQAFGVDGCRCARGSVAVAQCVAVACGCVGGRLRGRWGNRRVGQGVRQRVKPLGPCAPGRAATGGHRSVAQQPAAELGQAARPRRAGGVLDLCLRELPAHRAAH